MLLLCLFLYFAVKINDFNRFLHTCVCPGLETCVLPISFLYESDWNELFITGVRIGLHYSDTVCRVFLFN